ncbi:MAG: 3-alpha,7-alpha,12-alpha-trihydroxy-5-beta-cholest-24-enoyl-CoA hydratase [Sphingomonadales bacterium]|nr:MAG: 3-alpha,7-alpha,12-alpha-trihydroxy-5-beta-cholest-24-enoyl-CoA hydratase [Sphingomonadales bacterium]
MNFKEVANAKFGRLVQHYSARDTILYALGVGFASEPLDPAHIAFLYEDGLVAAPTMANVLGYPGLWMAEERYGIDWQMMLHAEQRLEIHAPLPVAATISAQNAVVGIEDRGERGVMMHQRNEIAHVGSGRRLATVTMSAMLRGDGGCGNWGDLPEPLAPLSDSPPDVAVNLETWEAQPFLYRLSGDLNPLHVDPLVASVAGFSRPILHGLATMGMAGYALLRHFGQMDAARLRSMAVRFTAPVLPGDLLRFEFWQEEKGCVRFRAIVPGRDGVKVLDRCTAVLA